MKIYAIVNKDAEGPGGHGEPGQPYVALYTESLYSRDNPAPLFKNKRDAEEYFKNESIPKFFYEIVELELV